MQPTQLSEILFEGAFVFLIYYFLTRCGQKKLVNVVCEPYLFKKLVEIQSCLNVRMFI